MTVAVAVAYALTQNWRAALAVGLIEPIFQTIAFALHSERAWADREPIPVRASTLTVIDRRDLPTADKSQKKVAAGLSDACWPTPTRSIRRPTATTGTSVARTTALLHALFMTHYTEMWAAIDLIAERIRALGEYAPQGYGALRRHCPDIKDGNPKNDAQEMLKELVADHAILVATAKAGPRGRGRRHRLTDRRPRRGPREARLDAARLDRLGSRRLGRTRPQDRYNPKAKSRPRARRSDEDVGHG